MLTYKKEERPPDMKTAKAQFKTWYERAKALLDIPSLMESKDQTADVQAAVNACKEENAYMFGDDEPINNPIGQTGGQTVTPPGKNPEDMSYEEYRAWREGK